MLRVFFAMAVSAASISLIGCSESPPTSLPSATTSSEKESESQRIETNLAKLSGDDRSSALAQGKCPVSGAALGSMGVPLKIDLPDQSIWICCDGCKGQLVADPDKFLKARDAAVQKP